jgi:hypothetical protein
VSATSGACSRYRNDQRVVCICAGRASFPNLEAAMGFGRGILLWLLGIPLPIIILLAIFWR